MHPCPPDPAARAVLHALGNALRPSSPEVLPQPSPTNPPIEGLAHRPIPHAPTSPYAAQACPPQPPPPRQQPPVRPFRSGTRRSTLLLRPRPASRIPRPRGMARRTLQRRRTLWGPATGGGTWGAGAKAGGSRGCQGSHWRLEKRLGGHVWPVRISLRPAGGRTGAFGGGERGILPRWAAAPSSTDLQRRWGTPTAHPPRMSLGDLRIGGADLTLLTAPPKTGRMPSRTGLGSQNSMPCPPPPPHTHNKWLSRRRTTNGSHLCCAEPTSRGALERKVPQRGAKRP